MRHAIGHLMALLLCLLAPLAFLGAVPPHASAQSDADPSPFGVTWIGPLRGDRYVTVHRAEQASQSPNLFFHQPVLAFVRNDNAVSGYPVIAFNPRPTSAAEDTVSFQVHVRVSSDAFRQLCRTKVIETPGASFADAPPDPGKVECRAWPTKMASLELRSAEHFDVVLARSPTQTVTGMDTWEFPLTLKRTDLAYFDDGAGVKAILHYTFKNVTVASARARLRIQTTIDEKLQGLLTSLKVAGDEGLFQGQSRWIQTALSTSVESSIQATDPALAPIVISLGDSWLKALFVTDPKPVLVSDPSSVLAARLAEYLRPTLRKEADTFERTLKDTVKEADTVKVSAGGKDVPVKLSKDQVRMVEHQEGVTFREESSTADILMPHSVTLTHLSGGWRSATGDQISSVYVGHGSSEEVVESPPISVRSTWDDADLQRMMSASGAPKMAGIWPGMAYCYFGKDIPHGFVLLDPSNTWPTHAPWLPEHLKGRPLPSTAGLSFGATNDLAQVGTLHGALDAGVVIDASKETFVTVVPAQPGHLIGAPMLIERSGSSSPVRFDACQISSSPAKAAVLIGDESQADRPSSDARLGSTVPGDSALYCGGYGAALVSFPSLMANIPSAMHVPSKDLPFVQCRWIVRVE